VYNPERLRRRSSPPEFEYLDGRPHAKVSPRRTHSIVQRELLHVLRECAGVDPAARTIVAHSSAGVQTYSSGDRFEHPAVEWLQFVVDAVFPKARK
jgi:hypothetical protein